MTATVNAATRALISANSFAVLSSTLGFIAIVLLIILIVTKELVRAYGGDNAPDWIKALDIGVLPLTVVFGFTIAMRLLQYAVTS